VELWSTPKYTVSNPKVLHYEGRSIFSPRLEDVYIATRT
jgi:hypothetical protein